MFHLLFVLSFLASPTPTSQPTTPAKTVQNQPTKPGVIQRGQALSATAAITLDEVAANPKAYANKVVVVNAKVSGVCKVKGCWMTVSGKNPHMSARITFKDYAFFVPKDCVGMNAKLEGKVQIKEMSDAERKHLADDANVSVDTIPKVELRIIAQGVELTKG